MSFELPDAKKLQKFESSPWIESPVMRSVSPWPTKIMLFFGKNNAKSPYMSWRLSNPSVLNYFSTRGFCNHQYKESHRGPRGPVKLTAFRSFFIWKICNWWLSHSVSADLRSIESIPFWFSKLYLYNYTYRLYYQICGKFSWNA